MKNTRPSIFALLTYSALLTACSSHSITPERHTDEPLLGSIELSAAPLASAEPIKSAPVSVSAEQTLKHYQQAFQHNPDPDVLRRMADLSLREAERRFQQYNHIDTLNQSPFAEHLGLSKKNQSPRNAFFGSGLNRNNLSALQTAPINANVYTAMFLYHTLLNLDNNPTQRSETLYQLAHAYSFAGEEALSLEALTELARHHQQSPLYVEAQFRRGEILFKNEQFEQAATAYSAVTQEQEHEFYQQSLYKLGWSQYKLAQHKQALAVFFTLYDNLQQPDQKIEQPEQKLASQLFRDTERVISLTLMQLDGPTTAQQWFAEHPNQAYELAVYQHLGDSYLKRDEYALAAQSYASYAAQHPTELDAPRLSQQEVTAYQSGGLQAELLNAKINFAKQYGVHSPYWAAHPVQRTEFTEQTIQHIFDVAQHYHHQGQKNRDAQDFLTASHWYEQFLLTAPPSERNAEIAHWQAQALADAGQPSAAIHAYELSAYTWPKLAASGDVAYESLLLYRTLYAQADEHDSYAWQQKNLQASLRYAQQFPQHSQVNPVLVNLIEDSLTTKALTQAIDVAGVLLAREPDSKLQIYALSTIANAQMDLQHFAEAETSYTRLLAQPLDAPERGQAEEQLALSIYRQAEAHSEEGEWRLAAAEFLRVGERAPNSSIRPVAQFDAANIYLDLSEYTEAIAQFKQLRASYPKHQVSETIPDKLAVAYENTNQHHLAAAEFSLLAAQYRQEDPELSRESLWRAAELEEKSGNKVAMRRRFEEYLKEWPQPLEQAAEAQYILAQSYQAQESERTKWITQLRGNLAKAPDNDRIAWLAGWAALEQATPEHDAFNAIRLDQPLRRSLKLKVTAMRQAFDHYQAAMDSGITEHVTQAQYQVGSLYETLAKDLMDSERPPNLDEFELDMYELDLEERAFPYEDQAIDYYLANVDLVPEGVYDNSVKASYEGLARLSPGRYNKQEKVSDYVDAIY